MTPNDSGSPVPSHPDSHPWWTRTRDLFARVDFRIWLTLILLSTGIFAWTKRTEVALIAESIRSTDPFWLAALMLLALGIQLLFSVKFTQILSILGHRIGLGAVAQAQLQRHAVATVVPAGTVPASLLFVRKLTVRGARAENVVLALLFFSILGHLSFVAVLVPTVIWLASQGKASVSVEYATVTLTVIVLIAFFFSMRMLSVGSLPDWLERRAPTRVVQFLGQCRAHGIRSIDLVKPFMSALAVDGAGITLLYVALRAAGERSSLGVAAGGYVVGTLFMMIAPVFQGIGLVEVSMALALNRLGVPHAAAISATLLYRVGELWLPLALGLALQAQEQPRLRGAPAHLPALVTAFTGVVSIISVMAPSIPNHHNRVEDYSVVNLTDASRTIALVGGICLLMLSYALLRRRRVAWIASISLSLVVGVTHLTKQHDQSVAVLAFANVALLLLYRRRFRVRADIPSLRRGIIGFCASLLFALIYGAAGFWLLDKREFGVEFTLSDAVKTSIRLYFSLGAAGLHPRTRYADWFLDSLSIVGVLTVVTAFLFLIRPVVWRHRTLPQERVAATILVKRHGRSSLDAFKATSDKLFFFSRDRDAVVPYGLSTGTAVVLGDPVAPDAGKLRNLIDDFVDFTDANGWQVAFHQVPPDHLELYRSAGLDTLKIGEEAVVDVQQFSLSGNAMKGLRGAVNRFEREGMRANYHEPPLSMELVGKLRAVSDQWLTLPGRRERGFTLGHWDDAYIRSSPVMAVENDAADVFAFVNLVQDGAPGEATFDLMRHDPDAPPGAMDFLLARLILHLAGLGYERLSLGLAPWSEVGHDQDASFIERRVGLLTPHLSRFFSVQGLRAYKEKFRPVWEARYLAYNSDATLPRIALALIRLTEGGDGADDPDAELQPEERATDALAEC